jgi:hypothetical protein
LFIDEWFLNDFYKKLPLGYHTNHSFGQIFWTHVYYPYEHLQFWRPLVDPDEPTKSTATSFTITTAGEDAFKRGYPLATPPLKTTEEFVVVRAKRRPVILIQKLPPLAGLDNRGFRGTIHRKRCLVAPTFSLLDAATGQTKFNPTILERMRRLEFPELLFLPQYSGVIKVDSMLRLDDMHSAFVSHLEPTQYALGDGVQNILKGQLEYLLTDASQNDFAELREILLPS